MKIIRVHSHEGAATLHPRRYGVDKAAMVRMTTMPDFVPLVFPASYVDVLELRFADVTAEGWKYIQENEADLIATMLEQGHAMWPMSEGHATSIIEFVDRVHEQIDLLVVHCDAGVSRSSAVAMSIAEKYGMVEELRKLQENRRYRPNLYIRDLLRKHYMPTDDERERLYAKLFPELKDD